MLDDTLDARQSIIKRAVKEGFLIRLKRNLYVISEKLRSQPLDSFELAQHIYGPSYISFESALSAHGWIPEAVRVVTSASLKRGKVVRTEIGDFTYEKVPVELFSVGVSHHRSGQSYYLMASPWKALADYLLHRKHNWGSLADLMDDLRIERESIEHSDHEILAYLSEHYPNARVRKIFAKLWEDIKT